MHTILYSVIFVALQCVHLIRGTQSQTRQVLDTEFSNYVERLRDVWGVKGVAMGVVKPGGDVEFGAWGVRSEDGEPMTPDTLFGIASCSKTFLAASLGILFDDYARGRNSTPLPGNLRTMDWNTKIKDVLPGEWELMDEWATEKTNFRDVLSHLSGLPRHDGSYSPLDSPADVVKHMRFLRPAHELREKFSYNNQMYMLGSHVVSKYTGSYTKFAKDRIFMPLAMDSTTFSPAAAAKSGELTHSWTGHGRRIPYSLSEEASALDAGAGGIISSVVDLSKWLKMFLNNGSKPNMFPIEGKEPVATSESGGIVSNIFNLMDSSWLKWLSTTVSSIKPEQDTVVLPRSVYETITTASTIESGRPESPDFSISGYGLGWFRFSYQGHEVISHSGDIPGFIAELAFFPDDNFGVVTLINTDYKQKFALALNYRVAEDILSLPHKYSIEKPSSPKPPPGLANTSTPLPLSSYSGTYRNPGYGSVTLCDLSSTSEYCTTVLSDFQMVDAAQVSPSPPSADVPQLFGAWHRLWGSHVRLVHSSRHTNIFEIVFTSLYPGGYGASTKPFETFLFDAYDGQVEFVLDEKSGSVSGFGMFGLGDMKGVRANGVSVEEGSIAWFEKV